MSEDLEALLRWEGAGGTWELVGVRDGRVQVNLLTCGRDQVMGVLDSVENDVRQHVGTDAPDAT